jgi:hypothetical protein
MISFRSLYNGVQQTQNTKISKTGQTRVKMVPIDKDDEFQVQITYALFIYFLNNSETSRDC